MASTMTIHLHVMDLCDADHRIQVRNLLNGGESGSIHQLDGTSLNKEDLLSILNALPEENEAVELSLEDLADLSGGVGLPEALVSSTMLMAVVTGASGVFSSSMSAVGQSQIQDALNAGVNANIEEVRNDLASQFMDDATGKFVGLPSSTDLGEAFINQDKYQNADQDLTEAGVQTLLDVGGEQVQRSIIANGHTIEISYTHVSAAEQISSTTMVSPAAGWTN